MIQPGAIGRRQLPLQHAGFDMTQLSIVGADYQTGTGEINA